MAYTKTIYKKDSKGKIRYLKVSADQGKLIQESGVVGTEDPVTHSSSAKAKNVGKANETTSEQQAELEAAAKVKNKMSTGYFETISEALNNDVILPMLAKEYGKTKHKIDWSGPVFVQPKLDGMRALYKNGKLISRKGKVIDTISHIQHDIMQSTGQVLDGELYVHGKSFQEVMKLIKKDRGEASKAVRFRVYDLVFDETFENRYTLLKSIAADYDTVDIVPTYRIKNEDELKEYHARFLSEGYEGTMVRHGNSSYGVNKRDDQLLKYKDFIDIAIPLKDVIPGDAIPAHGYPIFDWLGARGHPLGDDILGAGIKYSHADREKFLTNKAEHIGKLCEVRFFEYSDTGVPRFPVMYGFRDDK